MILLLFFCSGATALIYEVVWSKYLSLMFGSTVQAQTVVLAVFMGGLALGNRFIGGRSDLLSKPLAVYGYLEVAIGLYAFSFEWIYRQADLGFVAIGSRLLDHSAALLFLKGVLSVGLLLGPTILMGGTLPLLAAWLQKESNDAGRWSARFYSTNSLGAVFGAGLAGFFLVRALGMVATLQLTALANVIIGFTAVGLARRPVSVSLSSPSQAGAGTEKPETAGSTMLRWRIALVTLTGGVSMGLEVLASRSLALVFGSSVQAFAIVLMSFITGIGLGSAVVASPRFRRWQSIDTLLGLILAAAGLLGILVLSFEQIVEIYRYIRSGLARSEMGYCFHQITAGGIAMIVLGLPAGLLGAVLPLCMRSEAGEDSDFGKRVGRLLTWNTVGAVVGVLMTGFVLMPKVGLRWAFGLQATGLCVMALALAWKEKKPRALAAAGTLAGLILLIGITGGESWRHVLSSGVFRARETTVNPELMKLRRQHVKILFYEDAADATVTVEQGDGIGAPADLGLRINGKPEASTRGDMSTQLLVAHLPMLAKPESRDVFILGFGSGISAGAILAHPIARLVIAENCEPVLRAGKLFARWNRGVLTNSLVRIWNEDARTVLKLSPHLYDVIISQPSNPWMVGVGSVFSREYYELTSSRLKPGGMMVQWFHIYEMHDGIVNMVLRTFGAVFPSVEIWDTGSGDIVLLGSKDRWESSPELYRKAYDREMVRQDLTSIGFPAPEGLWARQFASQRTAFAIAGRGAIQSDAFPVLEYEAPKAFYLGATAYQLLRFDERTWQSELAPETKKASLVRLPDEVLRSAFSQSTVNSELAQYLSVRFRFGHLGINMDGQLNSMPCLFRPTNTVAMPVEIPTTADESLGQMLRAQSLLRQNSEQWLEAVEIIRSVLQTQQPPVRRLGVSSPAGDFAAMAARTCLAHGDWERARQLAALGLKWQPDGSELGYLARIIERGDVSFRPQTAR